MKPIKSIILELAYIYNYLSHQDNFMQSFPNLDFPNKQAVTYNMFFCCLFESGTNFAKF